MNIFVFLKISPNQKVLYYKVNITSTKYVKNSHFVSMLFSKYLVAWLICFDFERCQNRNFNSGKMPNANAEEFHDEL